MATDATEQFLLSSMPVSSNRIQTAEVLKPTKNLVIVKPCISPCFWGWAEVIHEVTAAGQISCQRAPLYSHVINIQRSDTQVRSVLYVM